MEPEIRLEPPSFEDLAAIIQDQDLRSEPDAALEMAVRSGGLPWQALLLYDEARAIAKSLSFSHISREVAEKAFITMGVDEYGLLPEDRQIITALLRVSHRMADGRVVHRMSQTALCATAGIDEVTFRERIQPKLYRQQLLTSIGGQTLTDLAEARYSWLIAPPTNGSN
jgi:Holliday junction resolvasome RuvABC ATP-dependent DNA helicase subunit